MNAFIWRIKKKALKKQNEDTIVAHSNKIKILLSKLKRNPIYGVLSMDIHKNGIDDSNTLEKVLQKEKKYIEKKREKTGHFSVDTSSNDKSLSGIALSGGGIRSATFSLGMLQCLAKKGLLQKFDYLSTVSGGGYIGTSLSWFLSGNSHHNGLDANNFPYAINNNSATDPKKKRLDYLRHNGNYLTPSKDITGISFLGVVIRAITCNILVWMPLLMAAALLFGTGIIAYLVYYLGCTGDAITKEYVYKVISSLFAYSFYLLLAVFLLVCSLYSCMTRIRSRESRKQNYKFRRFFEKWISYLLITMLLAGLLWGVAELHKYIVTIGFSGIMVVLFGLLVQSNTVRLKVPIPLLAPILAIVSFLLVILFSGYFAEWILIKTHALLSQKIHTVLYASSIISVALIVFSGLFGWFTNLNYISVHRYYRDRLMELYMPTKSGSPNVEHIASHEADKLRLSAVLPDSDSCDNQCQMPYHLINTHAILVNSDDKKCQQRGGDNFILSPYFCGSKSTGWIKTKEFMGDGMTLATAMAISGAAANPHGAPGGTGITRNRWISFAMAFFNLRLGYWANNPKIAAHNPGKKPKKPNHFIPGLYELLSLLGRNGLHEKRNFVQLADGGHFENLGIYELFRRKCDFIMVCDGSYDKDYTFDDLGNALNRAYEDFGVKINDEKGSLVDNFMTQKNSGHHYPEHARFSSQGYITIDYTYPCGKSGKLLYLKSTPIKEMHFLIKNYMANHPDFPDQTTLDQFFDEKQFDAYRWLGYVLCEQMF